MSMTGVSCSTCLPLLLQRLDNTLEDFSYRKCLTTLFPGAVLQLLLPGQPHLVFMDPHHFCFSTYMRNMQARGREPSRESLP